MKKLTLYIMYIFTLYIAQLQAICTNAASEKVRSQTQTEETDFIYYWQQLFVVVVMHLSYVRIIGQYQLGISKRIFFLERTLVCSTACEKDEFIIQYVSLNVPFLRRFWGNCENMKYLR